MIAAGPAPRGPAPLRRRRFLGLLGAGSASLLAAGSTARARTPPATLLEVPLELQGDWGDSAPRDVGAVLLRARNACLAGANLLSDRQPAAVRVENRRSGNPAIWLHAEGSPLAWIVVNVGPRDWSKLAYQFGHELGHVLANSWAAGSAPRPPCQWLEEAVVEAFSLRGLGRLADGWERRPVFPNDAAFGQALRAYRQQILDRSAAVAVEQGGERSLAAWFRRQQAALEGRGGPGGTAEAAVAPTLGVLEAEPGAVDDIGALNRWPGRSAVAIEQYLRLWQKSCAEIGTAGRLPMRLRDLLGVA